jgi:hypothetical protein
MLAGRKRLQLLDVRLLEVGTNRRAVLAKVRPLLGIPPAGMRALAETGPFIVATNLIRERAMNLACELEKLGAKVDIHVRDDCCSKESLIRRIIASSIR